MRSFVLPVLLAPLALLVPATHATMDYATRILDRSLWVELDNPVSIKDCNMSHPCNGDHFYNCEDGTFAKQVIVKYETGEACTTFSQCQADLEHQAGGNPPLCGAECQAILEDGGGSGPSNDDPSPTPAQDDDLAYCDSFGNDIPWWASECNGRTPSKPDTPSPTPRPVDSKDCSGYLIPADDPAYRLDWLADGGCDSNSYGGSGANFNCKAWGYDCCDCRSSCDPSDYDVCDGRGRRAMKAAEVDASKSAHQVKIDRILENMRLKIMDEVGIVSLPSFEGGGRQLVTTNVWSTMCVACQKGMWCPEGAVSMQPCPPGHYCPTPSKKIECPIDAVCYGYKMKECKMGMFCPVNATQAEECPGGSYCTVPHLRAKCPDGFYCRGGDTVPRKCSFYMKCPAGTIIPQGTASAFISLLICVSLLLKGLKFWWDLQKKKAVARKKFMDSRKEADKNVQSFFAHMKNKKASNRRLVVGKQEEDDETQAATRTVLKNLSTFTHLKPDSTPIFFEFNNLALVLKNGTRIIDRVTGKVDTGKLTAIMGPSGCG